MKQILSVLLLLLTAASIQAGEWDVSSPHDSFEIVQTRSTGKFTQTLHFAKEPGRQIVLEVGIDWPGLYYVSPDERWILRIQKTGSGDNISLLYHLDEHSRLWRMEDQVGALGFAYLATRPDLPRSFYHTGIEFVAWDLPAGLLRFTIHGTDLDQSGRNIDDLPLMYRLREGTITAP